ncbi:MAG TPA: proline--tRNA ligase [Candidatus Omnitrophota bacterium]|nr:proline--tRNA ligase [Candidatus Omnitrophota bacterium]
MKWSKTLIPTLREEPKDTEALSHKLLLRAGYIRKLSSGVYSYLPLGFRVLRKICAIIEEEMLRAGADELSLPALHPAELWRKTGRYEALGEDKLAFKNRTGQEFVLGPTHEEVITELAGAYIKSHRDLPKTLFQIQTKFRDELRPRFGVIRTKEFIMKDAYSFDKDDAGLDESYRKMFEAYQRIFTRCGLPFRIVGADSGLMGGRASQEFMVECAFGEDIMIQCAACGYLASRDIAERAGGEAKTGAESGNAPEPFDTPDLRTVDEITSRFKIKPERLIKTLIYIGDGKPVACLVRGDRELNEAKLRKLCGFQTLIPAKADEIQAVTGGPLGFSGPVGLRGSGLSRILIFWG